MVAADLPSVGAAVDDPRFVATFGAVSGDRLKRVPTGFAADHSRADLLKLKDVTFGHQLSDDDVFSPDLPRTLARIFADSIPLLELLAGLAPVETRAGWLRGG
jgi:uncharacterized protein (DUF2461 family)